MKAKTIMGAALAAVVATSSAHACTRILYETGGKEFIVGRSMDWFEDTSTDLWAFPKGMERDGGVGEGPSNGRQSMALWSPRSMVSPRLTA